MWHRSATPPGIEDFGRLLAPYNLPRVQIDRLAEGLAGASPALLRQLCENIKREMVVGPFAGWNMSKAAVFGRVLATVGPPPNEAKPRLWSHGADDLGVRGLSWPLQTEVVKERGAAPEDKPQSDGAVLSWPKAVVLQGGQA